MLKLNPEIFRAYDLRGVVGKDLDEETVKKIAQAYGTFLSKRQVRQAVVGYDARLSSESFTKAVCVGLSSTGVDVVNIGLSLVQMVYFAQYYYQVNGAVMVTASHNPKEYNGLKMAIGYSNTFVESDMKELLAITQAGKFVEGQGKVTDADKDKFLNAYYNDIFKRIQVSKKMKVVVDAANTAAGVFVPELLRRAGLEVVEKNCHLDGNFPSGTPDPTEESFAKRLSQSVKESGADIGFSFDSDGDRIGVVDEKGTILWNDVLIAIFADDILDRLPGAKIIYNTLSSKMVEEIVRAKSGRPIMWLVGHSFLKDKLKQERAEFVGELSGHFFFADNHYGHDDGCFTAMRLLSYLARKDLSLSQAIKKFPQYITSPEIKVGCPDGKKSAVVEIISQGWQKQFSKEKITDIDGIRIDFADSMMIIRYSQNGPYLTVRFEGKTQAAYERVKKYVSYELKKYPEIDWDSGVNLNYLR